MQADNELQLAVLIDADNTSVKNLAAIMDEITKYGVPIVKHAYGDWSKPALAGWKEALLDVAVVPVQQYAYTAGKNATDIALVIEAMDILRRDHVGGFVLVSSDSDFTPLALRLRESGKKVFGIGRRQTPAPFIKACDKFVFVEILGDSPAAKIATEPAASMPVPHKAAESAATALRPNPAKPQNKTGSIPTGKAKIVPREIVELVAKCIAEGAGDSTACRLSTLGMLLGKKRPEFDSRNYGFSQLSKLLRSLPRFEVSGEGMGMQVHDTDTDAS